MKKRGFTLMELVVVIAILAVLGLFLYPQVTKYLDNGNDVVCANNRDVIMKDAALDVAMGDSWQDALEEEIASHDKICPSGGTISIVETDGNYSLQCSLHGASENKETVEAWRADFNNFYSQVQSCMAIESMYEKNECLTDLTGTTVFSGSTFTNNAYRDYYLAYLGGSYPVLEDETITSLTDETLYVSPYFYNSEGYIFITNKYSNNPGGIAKWSTQYVQVNGTWYKADSVKDLNKMSSCKTEAAVLSFLANKGFTAIE